MSSPEAGPESVEVDVWIDHRGRIRAYSRPASGDSRSEYELWDYGEPGPVKIPSDLTVRE